MASLEEAQTLPLGKLMKTFVPNIVPPADLTVDAQDRIYIADLGNKRIQVFQYLGKPDLEEPESSQSDQ